jgi:hypothetical protein
MAAVKLTVDHLQYSVSDTLGLRAHAQQTL